MYSKKVSALCFGQLSDLFFYCSTYVKRRQTHLNVPLQKQRYLHLFSNTCFATLSFSCPCDNLTNGSSSESELHQSFHLCWLCLGPTIFTFGEKAECYIVDRIHTWMSMERTPKAYLTTFWESCRCRADKEKITSKNITPYPLYWNLIFQICD